MKTITIKIPTSYEEVKFEKTSDNNIRASFGEFEGVGASRAEAFIYLLKSLPNGEKFTERKFPNGFTNWHETHYFVSVHLAEVEDTEGSLAYRRTSEQGMGGLWELAQELTDEFEAVQKDRQWDGEWMDEIQQWLLKKDADTSIPDTQAGTQGNTPKPIGPRSTKARAVKVHTIESLFDIDREECDDRVILVRDLTHAQRNYLGLKME